MQYVLIIYENPGARDRTDEEFREVMDEYFSLNADLRRGGHYVAAEALEDSSEATTVRMASGETMVTDGPFPETKEMLGGFYLIEADSRAQAIEFAKRIPAVRHGAVEVRPVMTLPGRDD